MQNERCEAHMVTGCHAFGETDGAREGERCPSTETKLVSFDGELRALCFTHSAVAEAGTRELALVPPRLVAAAE